MVRESCKLWRHLRRWLGRDISRLGSAAWDLRPVSRWPWALKGQRPNLGKHLILELSVKIELPPGMPAWVVVVAVIAGLLSALALIVVPVLKQVFPETGQHKLAWWRSFWKQKAAAREARRQWRAQVRRERQERRAIR